MYPSVCPHETTRLPLDAFSLKLIFEYFFRKSVEEIKVSLKSDKNNGILHEEQYNFLSYLAHFVLECEIIQTKVVDKIKTHILCSITFFLFVSKIALL